MYLLRNLLLGLLLISCSLPVSAGKPSFTLANTIGSDMVIQQGKPFVLWGSGIVGTKISIKADWIKSPGSVTINSKGEWSLQIPVPRAIPGQYTPHQIILIAGKDTTRLTNLLFGDVWVCSGQSNMDMEIKPFIPWLQGALNYEQEIAAANYPAIRL